MIFVKSVCERCWEEISAGPNKPTLIQSYELGSRDTCSFCGQPHSSGIYIQVASFGPEGGKNEPR